MAVRYTQRLAEAGAVASVGSTGDSINALAEAFNSLFKAELVRNKGPWCFIDDLEIAVAEYLDWYNHRRLHGEIGLVPPVEHENQHYPHRLPSARQFRASTEPGARHLRGKSMVTIEGGTQALKRTINARLKIVPGRIGPRARPSRWCARVAGDCCRRGGGPTARPRSGSSRRRW